jgi:hypothetical protein
MKLELVKGVIDIWNQSDARPASDASGDAAAGNVGERSA